MRVALRLLCLVSPCLLLLLLAGGVVAQQPAPTEGRGAPPGPPGPGQRMSPEERAKFMAERQGRLKPGDAAPDFRLKVRGGEQVIQLASFRGRKPVALVFGSYT